MGARQGALRWLAGGIGIVILVSAAPPPQGGSAVVAADHVLASQAGREILARGGNAADAAVAVALSAGVVQPAGSGLGGGGFVVAKPPGLDAFALDFREVAPAAAREDMYRPNGKPDPKLSRIGGLAVAVPAEPVGLAKLVHEHGRLSLNVVAQPAIRHASRGFEVGAHLSRALSRTSFTTVQGMFSVGSRIARTGDIVRRPALATALRKWARSGGRALHTGKGAEAIERAVQATGGIVTVADLESYAPVARQPIVGEFRGYTVITMPPPSSGGVALVQLLSVLEDRDLKALGHNSSAYIHLLAEAMKHVYADRAHEMGDPDYVDVPVEHLLSTQRIDEISHALDPARTHEVEFYGERIIAPSDAGTQHISVLDTDGFGVALTTTINTSFGSGVLVPELGFLLNNEMDDFAANPGVPNAFGLVGNAANAVAAGKRPLSSMTPTVVLDKNQNVVLVVGASGGSTIISSTLQVLLNVLVFGQNPQEAVAAGRMHHQWLPDRLMVEPEMPADVVEALEQKGHEVVVRRAFSAVQVIHRGVDEVQGGADPRKGGWPASLR